MEDGEFKTCRFCQEKIRASAIKCRFCGEFLALPVRQTSESSCIEIEGNVLGSTEATPVRRKGGENLWRKHWRGELDLGFSFGLCVAGTFLLAVILGLSTPLFADTTLTGISWDGVLAYGLSVLAFAWLAGAAWKSSSRHVERGGRQRFASATRIGGCVLGLFVAAVAILRMTPQIREFVSQMAADARIPPYELRVAPGAERIQFSGGVRRGAAKELFRLLQDNPRLKTIEINSIAGRMDEAIEMAQLVSGFELRTEIPEQCFGPAALVFLAGKERMIGPHGVVAFDSGDFPGITRERREQYDGMALDIFREAGVKKSFANRALTSSPDQMWFPGMDELRRCGVVTMEPPEADAPVLVSHSFLGPN